MKMNHTIIATLAVGVMLGVSFGAGAYVYMNDETADVTLENSETVAMRAPAPHPETSPGCDDDNIVGKVAGGVIGGVAGSQFGSGNGKTAATIGGAVGGALLGEEYIPTRNATCG